METELPHTDLLPHLFRQEYARITAALCRYFGLRQVELAEDIASDTFLKASEHWALHGLPKDPVAWLYTVARNKLRDHLKHRSAVDSYAKNAPAAPTEEQPVLDWGKEFIADSQLAMIFAVCNPVIPAESQVALALQILCGFSVNEIAAAFLVKSDTIKKRLHRAKTRLRSVHYQIGPLSAAAIHTRLETVLQTLYLLFNEGYFSKTNDQAIRKELCAEALRLTLELASHPSIRCTQVEALLALMCFQSSRLDARTGAQGEFIPYEAQDRIRWDQALVDKGNYYLVEACQGHEVSRYHLEAAVAYWHSHPDHDRNWPAILQLYDQLLLIAAGPVVALNRLFVFAKVYGNRKAIEEAEKLDLVSTLEYQELLGYLYSTIDHRRALDHYRKALSICRSATVQLTLKKEIARLSLKA